MFAGPLSPAGRPSYLRPESCVVSRSAEIAGGLRCVVAFVRLHDRIALIRDDEKRAGAADRTRIGDIVVKVRLLTRINRRRDPVNNGRGRTTCIEHDPRDRAAGAGVTLVSDGDVQKRAAASGSTETPGRRIRREVR